MIRNILEDNDNVQPNDRTMEVLHREFPQCFNAEGKFDMAALQELLQDKVDLVKEGSGFNFLGKNYASLLSSMDTTTVLVPDTEHNERPENKESQNVYISGDNLDALKHLVKSYSGKVKCIYIDPPYNTGSDGFVYNDKFKFTTEELEEKLSINEEQAQRIFAMTTRGAASHAAWLTFMMPRLQYAKDLLSDDGVIFISIDDNEQANLKTLCDYVFGEENFVCQFIWISKTGGGSDNNQVVSDHEYVLCYFKNSNSENPISKILLESEELNLEDEYGPYRLGRELNKWGANSRREDRPTMFFPIPGPNGEDVFPIRNDNSEGCWRWGKPAMLDAVKNHNVQFSPRDNGTYIVYEKIRSNDPRTKPHRTFLKDCGTTAEGTKQIKNLFGTKVFDYPKPIQLIRTLLEMSSDDGDLIVDFFGGSSSTAHALLESNLIEGTSRNYIMVQLQEKCNEKSEAAKAGYDTIDQIGMERIKRAAKKIKDENPIFAGDLGFKHFTLQEPDENTIDQMLKFEPTEVFGSNLMEKFGKDTILATYAMRDGYGLTPKFEAIQFGNYTAYLCGKHLYMLDSLFNVEDDLTDLVDKYNKDHSFPADNVVIFGYSFNFSQTDAIKKNLGAITDRNRINVDIRY